METLNFNIYYPVPLANLFFIPADKTKWNQNSPYQPIFNKKGKKIGEYPNRKSVLKPGELLKPKSKVLETFFGKNSRTNHGLYILIFPDYFKFYVGIAAYSQKANDTSEGIFTRLKKHRAKCTGTSWKISHTNNGKSGNGWRDFALQRYQDFYHKNEHDVMQDCYLSIICFQNGDKLISENKVKLEMLEADISNQGLKNLFEGQFSNCLSFSHTTSRAINYIPNFTMLNFPC